MPDRPVRIVTGCKNSTPVRVVTTGGSPVRIVTTGGDPVRIVTRGVSDPVRVIGDCGIAPIYLSGEIGNVDDTTVVVTFSSDITAPCGDYALGFTIYVNGVADAITAATLSASDTISFTVTTAVVNGDAVTISYDSTVGCVTESCGVTDLETFTGESVTNNVVSAIWYRAGGAPMPIAAYQPKGAANLAASYVNLANPGTYDAAPGVAPTFNAATGWTFATNTVLTTGVNGKLKPLTYIARFVPSSITGSLSILWPGGVEGFQFYINGDKMTLAHANVAVIGTSTSLVTISADTVRAVTYSGAGAYNFYKNGATDGNGTKDQSPAGAPTLRIGQTTSGAFQGTIAALAVYDTNLSGVIIAALSTAMAAL